ncbi:WG repeat-containing protein [Chryseobacterium sp.]|uniref:WG repeat-containing protein n=1 Tax=Chryseobacterium sp. TaxID=1871047 RepID=UPI00388DF318
MIKNYGALFILLPMSFFAKGNSVNGSHLSQSRAYSRPISDTLTSEKIITFSKNAPLLIPQKNKGKYGYINHSSRMVIPAEYEIAMFFAEDCNLLNSENENAKSFGTAEYATVEKNKISYRIDKKGKKVYQYDNSHLGKCTSAYKKQNFKAYKENGLYGIIEEVKINNQMPYNKLKLAPKYDLLFILQSEDQNDPMIIAVLNNKFGIIDINNNIIIPFMYSDIKRNFSWKLGKMFEVTKDDKNYYFVDVNNKAY